MENLNKILNEKGYTCIAHHTTLENLAKIIETGYIYTEYERHERHIDNKGVYAYTEFNFDNKYEVIAGQYPGTYMHLVYDLKKIRPSKNEVLIILPLDLFKQKNWHLNLVDRNGTIGYDTYFHDTIHEIPHINDVKKFYDDYYIGNEIIFHNKIDISNCIDIIGCDLKIEHKLNLDLISYPSFLYYSDDHYGGINIKYLNKEDIATSNEFYINFTRNILPDKYKYLCDNCTTKKELEENIKNTKINNIDLFTYFFCNNTFS